MLGTAGSENVQGETQKKLDVISNDIFINANKWGGHLAAMASEEMDDIYPIPPQYPKGKFSLYCVARMVSPIPLPKIFYSLALSRFVVDSPFMAHLQCWCSQLETV